MKRTIFVSLIACSAFVTAPAMADLSATMVASDSYGAAGGGEFLISYAGFGFTPVSLGEDPLGRFESFCMEVEEGIPLGETLWVYFSDAAWMGGEPSGGDPLDPETAYLYKQFITGNLADYDYVPGLARVQSANALQNVIWFLEDEITNKYAGLDPAEQALVDLFLADAAVNAGNTIGDVMVMNLFASPSPSSQNRRQDVLVMPVPAPAAAFLGLIGLGMVGWIKRRFA